MNNMMIINLYYHKGKKGKFKNKSNGFNVIMFSIYNQSSKEPMKKGKECACRNKII